MLELEMNDGSLAWVVESSDVVANGEVVDTVFADRRNLDEFLEEARPTWLPDTLRTLEMHERRFSERIRYRRRRAPLEDRHRLPARDRVGLLWLESRFWVRNQWRFITGRHGEFARGERSERSRTLDTLWDSAWCGDEPLGYLLRSSHESRWVRFHSLPESKRYADSESEYAEIIRRHRTVLSDLLGESTLDELVVLATDYDRRDLVTGWVKQELPDAWPWRRFSADEDEDEASYYVWVQMGVTGSHLNALLRYIADDGGRFILTDSRMRWLYCAYDGGADVILPTVEERDQLTTRYGDWLPRG